MKYHIKAGTNERKFHVTLMETYSKHFEPEVALRHFLYTFFFYFLKINRSSFLINKTSMQMLRQTQN